jgi:uncharacterized repeat protein (TIGR01451 family)
MSADRYTRRMRAAQLLAWLLLGIAILLSLNMHTRHQESSAASTPVPAWSIDSFAYPSNFLTPAEETLAKCNFSENAVEAVCDTYTVTVTNIGSEQTVGGTAGAVTIEDTLPPGLTARNVSLLWTGLSEVAGRSEGENLGEGHCTTVPVRCQLSGAFFSEVKRRVKPDDTLKMWISTTVNEPASPGTLINTAKVTGGGAAEASATSGNTVGLQAPPFSFSSFSAPLLGTSGTPETQAGAHPYELSTQINLGSVVRETPEGAIGATTVHDIRDVIVDLPLGLAGSAVSAPTCTLHQLSSKGPKAEQGKSGCPVDTEVGHIRTYPTGFLSANSPLFNIVPERGVVGEFGFVDNAGGSHVLYASLAPTPAGYVLRTTSREIAQVPISQITADIYGDPAARARQREAKTAIPYATAPGDVSTFTNPEDCSGEGLTTTIHMDSWFSPGSYNPDDSPDFEDPNWVSASYKAPPVSGCAALAGQFNPTIEARPETGQADSPSGLDVNIKVPQDESPETLGTPPLKDAVVALPEGVTVNPSSANGLQACSLAEIGMSESGQPNAAAPDCPNASKIGTVELETPALPAEACKEAGKGLSECPAESEREKTPLHGSIYVAKQGENPFGSLLAIYIVIDDPRTGVIVKLPAEVKANEATGELTTVVKNSPQFPFSELRTHFFGGSTASLRTPATCGTYSVSSELTPWSSPESGPAATPSGVFEVNQGAGGGACATSAGQQPNSPSFEASTTPAAGAYSPLLVQFARADGSQNFSQINVTLPPGATGKLAGIPQCSEAEIAQAQSRNHLGEGALEAASPSCPAASAIGTVTVGAGAGPHPFYVTGSAYLSGPYKGAPFSAVFITPAIAGPFDLGVVVVRAGLYINPQTAQVTTRSDQLPSILHGIPLDIRSIAVNVNRPDFTLNPTNCTPMAVTGEETSTLGQVAPLSARFQVGGCTALPFKPKLTASVVGKASKANGASLSINITSAGLGQSNIAKVFLTLPKTLPSRLTTIQKACLASVFEANPASCDEGSLIGMATVRTPLLANPLSGPAYLVSHGSAAFPDVEFVLQGEGVTLILDGKTDIKKGITYSRFESTPDAPFTSFETKLPAGPHSALTANVPESEHFSLCKAAVAMPTEIVGQNGAVIKQTTQITRTGCPKVKVLTRAQKLAKALKACKKDKKKAKRQSCERTARKKFGAKKKAANTKKTGQKRKK